MTCPYAPEKSKNVCPLYMPDSATCKGQVGHDYYGKFRELNGGA